MAKRPTEPISEEPANEDNTLEKPAPDRMVRTGVLAALGRPPGLYEVAVRKLWDNHFRVNVLIGSDATSIRISHSFFVEARENGDIVSTTPQITKLYA